METPIVFTNPITGKIERMPAEMVSAYVPYACELDLEAAARVACIRDEEAADNLLLSVVECKQPAIEMPIPTEVNEPAAGLAEVLR